MRHLILPVHSCMDVIDIYTVFCFCMADDRQAVDRVCFSCMVEWRNTERGMDGEMAGKMDGC